MAELEKDAIKWCDVLDKNPGEAWDRRVVALKAMTKMFYESVCNLTIMLQHIIFNCIHFRQDGTENDPNVWTRSLFKVLNLPFQRQIKDLRSGITKEVSFFHHEGNL
jgi:hypothetical protein